MKLEGDYLNRVLVAVFLACGGSTNAHPPEAAVYSKLGIRRGTAEEANVPKALKILCRQGLIWVHPTGGEQTIQLTKEGFRRALEIYKTRDKVFDERLDRHFAFMKQKDPENSQR